MRPLVPQERNHQTFLLLDCTVVKVLVYIKWSLPDKKSNSKEPLVEPDVVEYEKNEMKPGDLILGINSMYELGIILDCKNKMTIDEIITLSMGNINSLTKSKTKSSLAVKKSTIVMVKLTC